MDYKFPIRIGIVGHKSLTDVEKTYVGKEINKSVVTIQRAVEVLRKKESIKSDFFISGISSLAEGAERVFATEIVNLPGSLEVVLPFRKELYTEDFWGDLSKTEFANLLSYDAYPMVIDNAHAPDKEWAYYNTSKVVIEQSDILLAVWDESPVKTATGGVANLIEYAKERNIPVVILLPRPAKDKDFEKENKLNIESLRVPQYNEFDKQWVPMLRKAAAGLPGSKNFNRDLLKKTLPQEDFAKFEYLLQLNSVWQKKAQSFTASVKWYGYLAYTLMAVVTLLALFTYCMNHLTIRADMAANLLPQGLHQYVPAINQSGSWLPACILLLLLALLFVVLRGSYIYRINKNAEWAFWQNKSALQLFKIAALVQGSELPGKNGSLEMFSSNAVSSRLFLISAKEVWNNFTNTLELPARTGLLHDGLLGKAIETEKEKQKKQHTNNKIWAWLLGSLYVLTAAGAGILLAGQFYPPMVKWLGNNAYLRECIQVIVLTAPLLCLIAEGLVRVFSNTTTTSDKKESRKYLIDTVNSMPVFCTTEHALEHIFYRTEAIILESEKQ